MKVGELCNRRVIVAEASEPVRVVADLMREHHVGCIVVVERRNGQRIPVGLVTDRDIAVDVVAEGRDPAQTPVGVIMSSEPYRADEQQDVYDVLQQMRMRGLRRVPVVARDGSLHGMFTFDDLVEWTSEHVLELNRLAQRELHRDSARCQAAEPRGN